MHSCVSSAIGPFMKTSAIRSYSKGLAAPNSCPCFAKCVSRSQALTNGIVRYFYHRTICPAIKHQSASSHVSVQAADGSPGIGADRGREFLQAEPRAGL